MHARREPPKGRTPSPALATEEQHRTMHVRGAMTGEAPRPQPKPAKREPKPRKPLVRTTRLKAKGKTAHARRPRDFDYMGKVAKLPCVVRTMRSRLLASFVCDGRIEVNHIGGRYGKDTDRNGVPMCHEHHQDWTGRVGGGGYFAGWTPARRRAWGALAIETTRANVATQAAWSRA